MSYMGIMKEMKLSIIIPYYKAIEYTERLMEVLEPQLTPEVEVIIVDDGCNEKKLDKYKANVVHLATNSKGASVPRNKGLDLAKGEYVTFIDADDMISEDYVATILEKIKSGFDYCFFSWNFKGEDIIIEEEPPWWNGSVCNCIYKRSLIGNERFKPIRIGEDKEFNERVRKGKRENILKVLYHYNLDNPNSITYKERGIKTIEHKNIIYVNDLNVIGGVETYVHELLKKYSNLDICVVYKTAYENQLKRIKQYCKAYKHTDEILVCDVCIINYDITIIPYICESAKIYQGIHADYDHPYYITHNYKPPTDPRIDKYIAITKHIADTFSGVSGIPKNKIIQHYNPLTIEDTKKTIILISPTRLTPEKGEKRMQEMVNALDNAKVNYIWFIFTDSEHTIDSPNVVYREPTLDIGKWMDIADYLVQLSDSEGCSYSINEMLYRNKPVIVTPLHYLDELGIKDGKNCYILKHDCSNMDHIIKNITKIPKFTFKRLEDNYDKILVKSKSHYKQDLDRKVELKCTSWVGFDDVKENRHIKENEIIEVSEERAEELLKFKGCFEVV